MQTAHDPSTLYTEFGARIYGYLRRLTQDAALAEDLTQETFLRAAASFQTFRSEGEWANWLYRIATNLFRDYLRTHKGKEQLTWGDEENTGEGEDFFSTVPDPGPSLPHILERQAVTQCVRDCIAALPAPYRATLLLYAVEGKTVAESAAILGCTKEAIKVRLHRARHLFKTLAAEQCDITVERRGEVSCLPKEPHKESMS